MNDVCPCQGILSPPPLAEHTSNSMHGRDITGIYHRPSISAGLAPADGCKLRTPHLLIVTCLSHLLLTWSPGALQVHAQSLQPFT